MREQSHFTLATNRVEQCVLFWGSYELKSTCECECVCFGRSLHVGRDPFFHWWRIHGHMHVRQYDEILRGMEVGVHGRYIRTYVRPRAAQHQQRHDRHRASCCQPTRCLDVFWGR